MAGNRQSIKRWYNLSQYTTQHTLAAKQLAHKVTDVGALNHGGIHAGLLKTNFYRSLHHIRDVFALPGPIFCKICLTATEDENSLIHFAHLFLYATR
jgi:hypothetical protein